MENASKALIIAGGVLIGIMVLSLLSYVFLNGGSFSNEQYKQIEKSQLQAYNLEFEKYMRKDLNASDILTVINKAKDINEKRGIDKSERANDKYYTKIEVTVNSIPGYTGTSFNETKDSNFLYNTFVKNYSRYYEDGGELKNKDVFEYQNGSIEYAPDGMVNKMEFKHRIMEP